MSQIHCQSLPIESNTEIAPGFFVLEINSPEIAKVSTPGQFAMIKPEGRVGILLGRPFSIFKKEDSKLSFLYKIYGKGSREISSLRKQDTVSLWGPLGRSFFPTQNKDWIFVAGGVGVAPFLFLAQNAPSDVKMTLLFGIKNKPQAILKNEFESLGCEVIFVTEDGSLGQKGLVTNYLEEFLSKEKSLQSKEILTCGPRPMESQVAKISKKLNLPCQVAFEEYMGCGIGTCMGCVVKCKNETDWIYKRVCREGPIFMSHEIIWEN